MTDGGEPSGGLVGSHNMGATSATGNAWTDPFIFPMAASLRAQYSRASSMFIFKISDGLASMKLGDVMDDLMGRDTSSCERSATPNVP